MQRNNRDLIDHQEGRGEYRRWHIDDERVGA
jgi:hypothetical protein